MILIPRQSSQGAGLPGLGSRVAGRESVRVSVFVWGMRQAESVGRVGERSGYRGPLTLTRVAHASRFPLVATLPPPLTRTVADLRWPETPVAHVGQARRHGTAKLGSEADLES